MGVISSIKDKFLNKGPSASPKSADRARRSGKKIRNPPNKGPQGPQGNQGPNRQNNSPQNQRNPRDGPNQSRNNPPGPRGPNQRGPDQGHERQGPPGPNGPGPNIDDRPPGGPSNPDRSGPQPPARDQSFNDEPGLGDSDRNQDRGFDTGNNMLEEPPRNQPPRGGRSGPSGQQRQQRSRPDPEDMPAPRHYNFDLPVDDEAESGDIQRELHELAEQNQQIIQLLQQIKNGMNQY